MASKAEEFLDILESSRVVSAQGTNQAMAYINHLLNNAPKIDVRKQGGDNTRRVYLVDIARSGLRITVEPHYGS